MLNDHQTAWIPPNFARIYADGRSMISWRVIEIIILKKPCPNACRLDEITIHLPANA